MLQSGFSLALYLYLQRAADQQIPIRQAQGTQDLVSVFPTGHVAASFEAASRGKENTLHPFHGLKCYLVVSEGEASCSPPLVFRKTEKVNNKSVRRHLFNCEHALYL